MITNTIKRTFATAGRLYTWGTTTYGWGRQQNNKLLTPGLVESANNVKKVATGPYHLIYTTQDKQVYSIGLGNNGRLGLGNTNDQDEPQLIEALNGVQIKQLSAGCRHNLALTKDGAVYAWGYGGRTGGIFKYLPFLACQSPLGLGQNGDVYTPTVVEQLKEKISHVAAGSDLSLAVGSSGKVYGWGSGIKYLFQQPSSTPKQLDQINYFLDSHHAHIKKVKSVGRNAFFLLDDGKLYVLGKNNGGVFASRNNQKVINDNSIYSLTQIYDQHIPNQKITKFKVSSNSLIFTTESGSVYYSGMFSRHRPTRFPVQPGTVKSIFATEGAVGVVDTNGKIGFLNGPFIDRCKKMGDVYVSAQESLKNAKTLGGTYGLKYAIVQN